MISKTVWRKRKKRCLKKAIHWCSTWNNIKTTDEKCHQKMYLYSASRWSWWSIYVPSTNKLVSSNYRANLSYSRNSFTRSIEAGSRCNEQKRRTEIKCSFLWKETTKKKNHSGQWIDKKMFQNVSKCLKMFNMQQGKITEAEMR